MQARKLNEPVGFLVSSLKPNQQNENFVVFEAFLWVALRKLNFNVLSDIYDVSSFGPYLVFDNLLRNFDMFFTDN